MSKAKRGIKNSIILRDKCMKYNLTFIDTTYDRNKVFE